MGQCEPMQDRLLGRALKLRIDGQLQRR